MSRPSRGSPISSGLYSKSTPNLPTLRGLHGQGHGEMAVASPRPLSPASNSALSEAASAEDNQDDEDDEDDDGHGHSHDDLIAAEASGSEHSDEHAEHAPASRGLYTSKSYSHLPRHTGTVLFPPFYNRPPTPLPPSPSLTSLLRPAFSRPTSRPTTPDSSDVDAGTSTPASSTTSLANSARHAPTVPRASPKVPTYEYYGFALYLGSSAAFLMYILWAYVPAPMLHHMGIHYYPNRWWALAVPCWLVVLVIYIYVALASYNTRYLTLPLTSGENLVDECAQVAVVDRNTRHIVRDPVLLTDNKETRARASAPPSQRRSFSAYQFDASDAVDWKSFWSTGTDAVMDVPIGGVCEILYGSSSHD